VTQSARQIKIFLIAAEESGDRLGASLMQSLRARLPTARFEGVGGAAMEAAGLRSLFPIDDMAIMGLSAIPRRLPMILRRIKQATRAVLESRPDVLVIIDSPDFTHRVAKRVRAHDGTIPIIDYVSPSVWAWRPGRAKAMHGYIDHVLALLPFEPDAHRRLGGPPCTYVGHPLLEKLDVLRPRPRDTLRRTQAPPLLLVLPGSRKSEIAHHMPVFGATLTQLRARGVDFRAIMPVAPHLADLVQNAASSWTVRPRIITQEDEKLAAFRCARAALAKSGTVTLELALAGVPMVTAYKGSAIEAAIGQAVVKLPSIILANLVLDDNVVPEFIQARAKPDFLAPALLEILTEGPARKRQLTAFAKLDKIMSMGDRSPSQCAADVVMAVIGPARRRA
jgi:lipid-A-disaccharide synthase